MIYYHVIDDYLLSGDLAELSYNNTDITTLNGQRVNININDEDFDNDYNGFAVRN